MKIFVFILLFLIIQTAFAQKLNSLSLDNAASLSSLAAKQYLSGKEEESLALYQKAIAKSEAEYGKNSRIVAALNYELGVRALYLSKFNLAEHSFKKAVEINPNCEATQLMLVQLLRFRNKDADAYYHTQQGLKKHPDSTVLHSDLVLCLQDKNPASATQQAFYVSCLQNGLADKIPALRPKSVEKPVEKAVEKPATVDQSENPAVKGKKELTAKNATKEKTKSENHKELATSNKAIYQPIKPSTPAKSIAVKASKRVKKVAVHKSSSMPIGLVPPPPPPSALGFPMPPQFHHAENAASSGMKAKAESIKANKTRLKESKAQTEAPIEESKRPAAEHPSGDSDPDFLIEWASVKKKQAKQ